MTTTTPQMSSQRPKWRTRVGRPTEKDQYRPTSFGHVGAELRNCLLKGQVVFTMNIMKHSVPREPVSAELVTQAMLASKLLPALLPEAIYLAS